MCDDVPPYLGAARAACRLLRRAFAGASLVWIPVLAQTPVVGKLPGEFGVSASGAATYRIPIEVPPGVAGMEPKLALSYNSQAGNGILGVGWSLEGLSAITRCPKTMATDGVRGSVKHNVEDRFCLDGQRLINVVGSYGAAGSEYRTELESFSKVTAVGVANGSAVNGPERFTVKSKAGLTLEYGGTPDSRIEAHGKSVVRVWALNRMSDAKGNVIDYSYTENNANGEYLISTVTYAGRSLQFTYEDRPDKFMGYQAGMKVSQTQRMLRIQTLVAAVPISELKIQYLPQTQGKTSIVEYLKRCTVVENTCLIDSRLEWSSVSSSLHGSPQSQANSQFLVSTGWFDTSIHNRVWFLDINNDSLPDVLGLTDGGIVWQLNTGAGFGVVQSQPNLQFLPSSGWFNIDIHNRVWVSDINGDSYPDILGLTNAGIVWQLGTGAGFGMPQSQADNYFRPDAGWFSPGFHGRVWVTDINGDGRPDILGINNGEIAWQLNTGSGFANAVGIPNPQFLPSTGWFSTSIRNRVWVLDLNGDSLPDILGLTDGGIVWQMNNGAGFDAPQSQPNDHFRPDHGWFSTGTNNRFWIADVNGDSLPDMVGLSDAGILWQLNTGAGFDVVRSQPNDQFRPDHGWFLTTYRDMVSVLDVNGDGLADILGTTDAGIVWQLSTGSGFDAPRSQPINQFQPSAGWFATWIHSRVWVSDIGGDGLPDLLGITDSGIYWQNNLALPGARRLTAVNSGEVRHEIQYTTLAKGQGSTYVKDAATAIYPQINLQTPMYVVSKVSRSNGAGGLNETTYSYGGLKAEQASAQHPGSGRGLLGFRWMKSKEVSTGLETYTEYSQSWPTIGQVVKSETRLAGAGNAGLLKQSTASYGCYQSAAAVGTAAPGAATTGCGAWSAGKVYFPFLSQSVEDSWDLNGVAMPRLSTSSTYAGYAEQGGAVRQFGDPTQVQVEIHEGGVLKQRKATSNEYQPAKTGGADWQLGRLRKASVISSQY